MVLSTILTSLLPIIHGEYQETTIITQLRDYFDFDHHFFLLDSTANPNRLINNRNDNTPQTVYILNSIDHENIVEIGSKNTFMIVGFASSNFDQNFYILQQIEEIQRLQIEMKIGVFFLQCTSIDDLHKFFRWCKDHLIVNIFAATYLSSRATQLICPEYSINIFTFDPFDTFDVINVTSKENFDDFFPSLKSNFHQHQLRLDGLHNDSDETLWRTVFHVMNASFTAVNVNFTEPSEAFESGIDIISELWGLDYERINVYPLELLYYVIVVPEALPYSEFSAFLRNATSMDVVGYCIITLGVVTLVLTTLRYINQKKFLIYQSVVDILNLLVNNNGFIKYQKLHCTEIFIIVPLTFVGFIVTNGILSNLQSYLTRPVLQSQINTIEDVYSSTFPIVLWHDSWKSDVIDVLSEKTVDKSWEHKVVFEEVHNFTDNLELYSRNKVYMLDSGVTNFLLRMQKRMNIKGYHKTNITMFILMFSYRVNENFLYFERLNEIIHRIKSAGLYDLWIERDFGEREYKTVKKNSKRMRTDSESFIQNFEFPTFVFYGWTAGSVVFIFEIMWKSQLILRIRKNQRKLSNFLPM